MHLSITSARATSCHYLYICFAPIGQYRHNERGETEKSIARVQAHFSWRDGGKNVSGLSTSLLTGKVVSNTIFCTEAPTPLYGHYLTHAHNHITPAVSAMKSCFVLIITHQLAQSQARGRLPIPLIFISNGQLMLQICMRN